MRFFFNHKPLFLQRLILISLIFAIIGCVTTGNSRTKQGNNTPGNISASETGTVVFHNKTYFTVNLVRGSGRVDVGTIAPGASLRIQNSFERAEDYYPEFIIPLTRSFSLPRLRPQDRDFYYRIDNNKAHQEIEINAPENFNDTSAYIIFTNNSRSGGVSLSYNDRTDRMTGINFSQGKDNVNTGETVVYRINPREVQSIKINPNIKFDERTYLNCYSYSFSFDGSKAALTDIRPLHRVGEPSWAKTISNSAGPMQVISSDGQIQLFYQSDREIIRNSYNSNGNEITESIKYGEAFNLNYTDKAGDAFLIAGFNELSYGNNQPIARIHGEDGVRRRSLESSNNRNAWSANILSAAKKDSSAWFLAGGSAESYAGGHLAYVRHIRNENSGLNPIWELTGSDFAGKAAGFKFGEINAADYNSARDRLYVSGMHTDSIISYVVEIGSNGRIQNVNTSFKDLTFYKIITASDGSYFLIGEEHKGNNVFAYISKYDSSNKQLWNNLSKQAPSNSYYHDAVLDSDNNRIILAGTMQAREENGKGGTPFIDAVNTADGSLLWREALTDSSLREASLVTAIAHAPDYGFVITLSGVGNRYEKPFIIARVNSEGKFFKQ